jgi:hypothetical protein
MIGGIAIGIRTKPTEKKQIEPYRYTKLIGSTSQLPFGPEAYTSYKILSTTSASKCQ